MIQLYRGMNPSFRLDSRNPSNLRCVTKAVLERNAMEEDSVSVTLVTMSPCAFEYRDYIVVDGRPYFLNVIPKKDKTDRRRFATELKFEGGLYELGRVAFTMSGLHGWDFTGQLYDFCRLVWIEMNRQNMVIVDSLNRVLRFIRVYNNMYVLYDNNGNSAGFVYSIVPSVGDVIHPGEVIPGQEEITVVQVGGAWTLDFELDQPGGKPITTDEKYLTYDSHTCLEVMQDLMTQWEDWEFYIDVRTSDMCNYDHTENVQVGGKIIVRKKSTGVYQNGVNTTRTMAFGKKGGIGKITTEPSDGQNMPSRIYVYGGTQNLPTTYRNTRICLPDMMKEESYITTPFVDNEPCEAVKIFDDIFPACQQFSVLNCGMIAGEDGKVFGLSLAYDQFFDLFARWKDPFEETPSDYGSYDEWKKMYNNGNADLDRYLLYYYAGTLGQEEVPGFPKSCYLLGDTTITFQTGNLAGRSFKIKDFQVVGAFAFMWLFCEGVDSVIEGEPMSYFPNDDIMCSPGDKFTVEGCLMPASFVYSGFGSGDYAAEVLLQEKANEYRAELEQSVKVGVEIAQEYVNQNSAVFRMYDGMTIKDQDLLEDFGLTVFSVRKVTHDMLKNSYKVEIDNGKKGTTYSVLKKYIKKISVK